MKNKNNPLSPHIQIYNWHISSLISISNRITGVINIIALIFVSIWISSMLFGATSYEFTKSILTSFFGKFVVIGIIWSFSFQILSEIRHLFWDLGLGLSLRNSYISGYLVILISVAITIISVFYLN